MPLLTDDKESEPEEPYEFEEGQESVAKLLHLIYHKSNSDLYYELLLKFKRVLVKGGIKRMRYTLPALCFSLFRLSNELTYRAHHDDEGVVNEEEGNGGNEETKTEEDEFPLKLTKVDHN